MGWDGIRCDAMGCALIRWDGPEWVGWDWMEWGKLLVDRGGTLVGMEGWAGTGWDEMGWDGMG